MYVAAVFIQSQAERHCGIRCRPLAVIGNGKTQGRSHFGSVLDGHVLYGSRLGNVRRENQGVYVVVKEIKGQGRPQRAFHGAVIGRRAFASGKPVQGCRPGPGAGKQIVAGCITQCSGSLRIRLLPQVKLHVFHNRRCFAGIPVYGNTACHRCVISGSGRRIIAVNWLVARKIPFGFYFRIPKPFLQCGQGTFDVCLGCFRSLVFHGRAYTAPLGKRIKAAVILGIGDALQGHGIYRTAAVARHRDIPCGHAAFVRPLCRFGSQRSSHLFLRQGK